MKREKGGEDEQEGLGEEGFEEEERMGKDWRVREVEIMWVMREREGEVKKGLVGGKLET